MVAPPREGWELGVGLLMAAGALFDELHRRLAEHGHADLRPAHGYAFQAMGSTGATTSELAGRLHVTKQAAGQMAAELERRGYVRRGTDPADARRRPLVLTTRGVDALSRSAAIFADLQREWAARAGGSNVEEAATTLDALVELYGQDGRLRPVW
jgi:DNA-binding MarR family transcriptional regulator